MELLTRIPLRRRLKLSSEEQRELARLAQNGDIRARNRLVMANLGLVLTAVYRCSGDEFRADVFDDLILTAMDCIRNYRPDSGAPFGGYLSACLELRRRAADAVKMAP